LRRKRRKDYYEETSALTQAMNGYEYIYQKEVENITETLSRGGYPASGDPQWIE